MSGAEPARRNAFSVISRVLDCLERPPVACDTFLRNPVKPAAVVGGWW
jgi:hypothetical protein